MRKIVYYVAISLDGYIEGPNQSIDGYVSEGSGLEKYLEDLKTFDAVIMGKNTYEFGFKYGVVPGQPAYENMEHYIFSNTANYPDLHEKVHVEKRDIARVKEIKESDGGDIYLCGASIFAGWLFNHKLVDEVVIKLSPALFGEGLPLTTGLEKLVKLELESVEEHDHGMLIIKYKVVY